MAPTAASPLAVLVVCTANICRSPMGEAVLRHRAQSTGTAIDVSSAGFLLDGESPPADTIAVMAELGLDISGHRSRIVQPEMVRAADLVVTMERSHARSLAVDVPDAADKVHTLGAVVAGLAQPGSSRRPFVERITTLGGQRAASDLLGRGDDEVADPYGRARKYHRRTADRLDFLMTDLVAAIDES